MDGPGSSRSELVSRDDSLRRLVRVLAPTVTDADDLAQEVWLSALRRPEASAQREWFRVVARRTLWRWSRRERARSARERLVARPEAHESSASQVETASLREYLGACVDALKDPYREVVRLHYLDDLSVDEIADRLGRPAVTVRVQLKRGLDLLRARLSGRRGRFLGWIPFLEGSASLPGWARRADVRALALGASAVALAVVLLAVVPVSGRGRAAPVLDGDRAAAAGAALATPPDGTSSGRLPGELAAAPGPGVPQPASILLGGRVLAFDGTPVAGAPVFLRDRWGQRRVAAVSGEDGRYEVRSAALDDWIEAEPAGHLPSAPHLVCSLAEGRALDLIAARPSGVLRGRVLDAHGGPVAGAEVLLRTPVMTSRVGSLLATTLRDELLGRASFGDQATVQGAFEPTRCRTDASGRFEAAKPPEEKFLVLASAPGLPPGLALVESRAGADAELELRLELPARLAGRVLDEDGRPCAGALLELAFPEPRPRGATRTDPSGRFRFEGLGSGPYVLRLLAREQGHASCHVEGRLAVGEERDIEVQLSAARSIRGTLAVDGRPLGGWTVSLLELADRDFPARDARETRSASDGSFAFLGCSEKEHDLEFFDPELPAQRHRVGARASSTPLLLEARPAELVSFHGRLAPREGAPRPSLLSVAPVRGSLTAQQTLVALDAATAAFHGPSLPRGTYHVDAFFPGSATAWRTTVELTGEELVLAVPARGTLRLELELPPGASSADAEAFVRVRAPLATYWIHAPMERAAGEEAFVAELMPGTYWVLVLLEGHAAECVRAKVEERRETLLTVAPKQGTPLTLQVVAPRTLRDGETLRIEIQETGRRVPVPFFREAPGESATWWAGLELTADARRIAVSTTGGLAGELGLTPDLVTAGSVLRIELAAAMSGER